MAETSATVDASSAWASKLATRRVACFRDQMSRGPVKKRRAPSDEELLKELRRLLAERGKLTMSLIEASRLTHSPNTYIRRFGSLMSAYERIGYQAQERQRAAARCFRRSAKP